MDQLDPIVPVEHMDLVGGDLCLDLVNTANGRGTAEFADKLGTYADLVTWAERVRVAGPRLSARLRARAASHPAEADAVLHRARALRELIYRVFAADRPAREDLAELGKAAAEAAAERRLEAVDGGYAFVWPERDALAQLLWPVALSAAELLVSEDRERVKQCAGDTCNWLFLDQSRNRSRRWCDMKDCGNRAKARRFQARQRGRTAQG